MEEIVDMMKERKLSILGLSECKWKGCGEKHLRDGFKLWWSGGTEGKNGVGMVVSENLKDFVTCVENRNDRIMKISLKLSTKLSLDVVQIYAPQTGRPMNEKDEFGP